MSILEPSSLVASDQCDPKLWRPKIMMTVNFKRQNNVLIWYFLHYKEIRLFLLLWTKSYMWMLQSITIEAYRNKKFIVFMLSDWLIYCDIQFYHTHNPMYIITKHPFKAWISLTVRYLQLLIYLCLAMYIQIAKWRPQDDLSRNHFRLLQTGKLQID